MILAYMPTTLTSKELQRRTNLLNDNFCIFFLECGDGIEFITETNQKLLRQSIIDYNPIHFWIYSLNDFRFSKTEIAELIIFLLKHQIPFQSEQDNIYLDSNEIDKVYELVFDKFKSYAKAS